MRSFEVLFTHIFWGRSPGHHFYGLQIHDLLLHRVREKEGFSIKPAGTFSPQCMETFYATLLVLRVPQTCTLAHLPSPTHVLTMVVPAVSKPDIQQLKDIAQQLRIDSIRATNASKSG